MEIFVCVRVHACAHVFALMWSPEADGGYLVNSSPPYFVSHSLSLGLELTHQLASASELWGSPHLCLPITGITGMHYSAQFSV